MGRSAALDALLGPLDDLEAGLRALLERLQDEGCAPEHLEEAWCRCEQAQRRYARASAEPRELEPRERELHRARLESGLRLNAVALGLLEGERMGLVARLAEVEPLRRSLHARRRPAESGRSCDVVA